MKKVVTVSLGASKQDFRFETDFLGQHFQVQRLGADDDIGKAWELMRRHQATADAIGLGEVGDHFHVGQNTLVNKETHRHSLISVSCTKLGKASSKTIVRR